MQPPGSADGLPPRPPGSLPTRYGPAPAGAAGGVYHRENGSGSGSSLSPLPSLPPGVRVQCGTVCSLPIGCQAGGHTQCLSRSHVVHPVLRPAASARLALLPPTVCFLPHPCLPLLRRLQQPVARKIKLHK